MPTPPQLFIGLIAGAVGVAYFVYGKKESRFAPMISGVALCVYPYLVSSVFWLCVIGIVLIAAPFVFDA
jgi:predicted cobalt transporter CbtA